MFDGIKWVLVTIHFMLRNGYEKLLAKFFVNEKVIVKLNVTGTIVV